MQTLHASKCGLSTAQLPSSILDVIDSLTKAGYEAYIVGGGVRDLMLGLNPKDFDAVTNATPNQVKEVFGRRCRIIGRRFELAHVYSGRELIEVATFRAPPKKAVTSAAGMILNVDKKQYGSVYDPTTGEELTPGMNGRSFNVVLNMMKENKNSILVDKSKTILNNHKLP